MSVIGLTLYKLVNISTTRTSLARSKLSMVFRDRAESDSYSVCTRRALARLRQPEPRMRLAVRGVPKGALRTHSA